MVLPNFLIIGAPRTSTTTLYELLIQHPDIYMSSVKEPWFFALEERKQNFKGPVHSQGIRDLETYQALFSEVTNQKAIGEASTLYLYSPEAPRRIKKYIPDVKLIAILRNPVDRAYSNFMQHVIQGRETITDFGRALDLEAERKQKDWQPFWFYRGLGFYGEQLERYYNFFNPEQIKVVLFEDLCRNQKDTLKSILQFLNIDDNFEPSVAIRHNSSGVPKNETLHTLLTQSNVIKRALKPIIPRKPWRRLWNQLMNQNLSQSEVNPKIRLRLLEEYREDILKTQTLIQRDLSMWLKV